MTRRPNCSSGAETDFVCIPGLRRLLSCALVVHSVLEGVGKIAKGGSGKATVSDSQKVVSTGKSQASIVCAGRIKEGMAFQVRTQILRRASRLSFALRRGAALRSRKASLTAFSLAGSDWGSLR